MARPSVPAPPPKLVAARPSVPRAEAPGRFGTALNRTAGQARDWFESLEVKLERRPRTLLAARALRHVLRFAVTRVPRVAEAPELAEARGLGHAAPVAPGGENVLVMSFRGWTTHAAFEMLVGHALRRRGATPSFVVCGGGLPRTELGRPRAEFPHPCDECRSYATGMLQAAALPYVVLDDLVDEEERLEISDLVDNATDLDAFEIEGIRPAEHVVRSTLWVARSGLAGRTIHDRPEFREFIESAAIAARAFARLLDRDRPASIVMVSGLFFAESVMLALAKQREILVVTYDISGKPGTIFVSDGVPASFLDVRNRWDARASHVPTPEERKRIERDVAARLEGSDASLWSAFDTSTKPPPSADGVVRLAAFTNVSFDTAVVLRDIGYGDMFGWLEHIVSWAITQQNVELDVRAHPAETRIRGFESSDLAIDFLSERFPDLPPNIRFHGPESTVDSYALIQASTAVLVYSSTIGFEAVLLGRPVLVSADVHYRGKGFTYDVTGPDHLEELLRDPDRLVLDPEQHERALAYAQVFFYESMIPLRVLDERWRGKPRFALSDLAELDDDPAVRAVCDLALRA